MTNEDIVMSRIVNQQVLDFNGLCEYLADGSTVTAADVSAVMKLIELRLPLILGLNAKVICSPEGLTFREEAGGEAGCRPHAGHRRQPRPGGQRPVYQRSHGEHRHRTAQEVGRAIQGEGGV